MSERDRHIENLKIRCQPFEIWNNEMRASAICCVFHSISDFICDRLCQFSIIILLQRNKTIDELLFGCDLKSTEDCKRGKKNGCLVCIFGVCVCSHYQQKNSLSHSHDSMLFRQFHCNQNNDWSWNAKKDGQSKMRNTKARQPQTRDKNLTVLHKNSFVYLFSFSNQPKRKRENKYMI